MALNVNGRKIIFFRCTIDPSIPPRPMNAFDCTQPGTSAELTPAGVYCKRKVGKEEFEFIVPYANVSTIKLGPEEEKAKPDEKAKG